MILPDKHLDADRALITVAAELLTLLSKAKTVSAIWNEFQRLHEVASNSEREPVITFDWFVLALDVLFALGTIEFVQGKVTRIAVAS